MTGEGKGQEERGREGGREGGGNARPLPPIFPLYLPRRLIQSPHRQHCLAGSRNPGVLEFS